MNNPLIRFHAGTAGGQSALGGYWNNFLKNPSFQTGAVFNQALYSRLPSEKNFINLGAANTNVQAQAPNMRQRIAGGRGGVLPPAGGGGGMGSCCQQLVGIGNAQLQALNRISELLSKGGTKTAQRAEGAAIRSRVQTESVREGQSRTQQNQERQRAIRTRRSVIARAIGRHLPITSRAHRAVRAFSGLGGIGEDMGVLGAADEALAPSPIMKVAGIAAIGGALTYEAAKKYYRASQPWIKSLRSSAQLSMLTGTGTNQILKDFYTNRRLGALGVGALPQWMSNLGYTGQTALGLSSAIGLPYKSAGMAKTIMQKFGRASYIGGMPLNDIGAMVGYAGNTGAVKENQQSVVKYLHTFQNALKGAAQQGIGVATTFRNLNNTVHYLQGLGPGTSTSADIRWFSRLQKTPFANMRTGTAQLSMAQHISHAMMNPTGMMYTLLGTQVMQAAGGKLPTTSAGWSSVIQKLGFKKPQSFKAMAPYLNRMGKGGNAMGAYAYLFEMLSGQPGAILKTTTKAAQETVGKGLAPFATGKLLGIKPYEVIADMTAVKSGKKIPYPIASMGPSKGAITSQVRQGYMIDTTAASFTIKASEVVFRIPNNVINAAKGTGKTLSPAISDISKFFFSKQGMVLPLKKLHQYEHEAAKKYGVPYSMIKSVQTAENAPRNVMKVSKTGAIGLMQIEPGTWNSLGMAKGPYSASENIKGGAKYLRMMLEKSHGHLGMALRMYNAGPNKDYAGLHTPGVDAYVHKIESEMGLNPAQSHVYNFSTHTFSIPASPVHGSGTLGHPVQGAVTPNHNGARNT